MNFLIFSVSSFFLSSSFHSRFFVSLSCESSILFTSLFKNKKNPPRVFHNFKFLHLSSFICFSHHFLAFTLSNLPFSSIFSWSPFLSASKKLSPLNSFSSFSVFFSLSLSLSLSPCPPIPCVSYLLFAFISVSFLSPFFLSFFLHLPFVHLLFLDLIFLFTIFLCLVLSFTSFVTDLICLYFLLASKIFLCSFRFSCRFCLVASASFFCVNPSLFVNLLFSLLCSVVFAPPFIFFFLTVFLHYVFHFFVGSFTIRLFFYFFFLCISLFSLLVIVSLFSSKICLFMLVSFLPFSFCFDLFQQKYLFSVSFSLFSTFSKKQIPFFSRHLVSFLVFLANKKTSCSNFHFDRPHSNTYFSRCFFYQLTLFMFPLLCMYPPDCSLSLCPPSSLLLSFFLVAKHFLKKKNFSLPFIFARPSCFFSVSFFVSSFHLFL